MPDAVLSLEGLTAGYDQAAVIRGIDLTVAAGEVVALLGANGAGKTTILRAVSGLVKPMAGRIVFDGADLVRTSPSSRAQLGIASARAGSSSTNPPGTSTSRSCESCRAGASGSCPAASSRCSQSHGRSCARRG